MSTVSFIVFIMLLSAAIASYKTGKLTFIGAVTGAFMALAIYAGTGLTGIIILALFFILATIATSHSKHKKGTVHSQRRDALQVLANGGVAGLAGLLAFFMPNNASLALIIIAAALSSATADTVASELGTVYGKRFYNIVTFKPDKNGKDGVISLEGTLAGLAGSAAIAAVYGVANGWNSAFFTIIFAGTTGNITDSVLGETLENEGLINNNEVNFLNTVVASAVCCALLYLT